MRPLRDESGQLAGPRAGFARHSSKIVCLPERRAYMVHTYAVAIAPGFAKRLTRYNLPSEVQLAAELNFTRIVGGGDLAVLIRSESCVDRVEVGVIEGVEELGAELKAETLADLVVLDRREVP